MPLLAATLAAAIAVGVVLSSRRRRGVTKQPQLVGGPKVVSSCVVRPALGGPADEVLVSAQDGRMARLPLWASGYPAYGFGFAVAPDPDTVTAALAQVLSTWRIFAGRFRGDGKAIVLSDEGMPFALLEAAAPLEGEEAMWRCADFRRGAGALFGYEPLATATLTRFPDGSGVLTVCRSHGLGDGATLAMFVADWSKAIAGKALEPIKLDRSVCKPTGLSEEEVVAEVESSLGRLVVKRSAAKRFKTNIAFRLMAEIDLVRLSFGGVATAPRPRLLLSHAVLATLKDRASEDLKTVPWITTQEAFIALLLLALPSFFNKGPKVSLLLWLDARRYLGEAGKRLVSGTAILTQDFHFHVEGKSLSQLAEEVHIKLEAFGKEDARKMFFIAQGQFEYDLDTPVGPPKAWRLKDADVKIMLNNQSKLPLVDLGSGPAEWVCSTSGPTLMVPHKDGTTVLFDSGTVPGGKAGCLPSGLEEKLRSLCS
mmetsp:Transcript_182757/g.578999  ORF Transcript_182757/g.578999 Transcript_182757/m.578999 type:complete len:482 (+) Transcript_182757:54-1499(+)